MLHDTHRHWIDRRKIDPILAEKLGLCTTRDAGAAWLSIPYVERGKVVNHKHRLTSEKRHRMDQGAPLCLWNHDVLLDERVISGEQAVLITEGEWDALVAMTAGYAFTVSVPNGAPSEVTKGEIQPESDAKRFSFIWRSRDLLDRVGSFILATDSDGPGRILAAELARRLGPERCRFVTYPEGCKDLNDVALDYSHAAVIEVINAAKPYPVKGLYRFSDFPSPPPLKSISLGLPVRDDSIRLVPGTLVVWTGFAGAGKTSLLMFIIANLLRDGLVIVMGSFETMVKPILHDKLVEALCRSWGPNILAPQRVAAEKVLEEQFSIIAQDVDDEDHELTLEELLELARIAVLRDGARLLIIDPWNEIEHKRRRDEGEHDYTGRAIRSLKSFAKQYDCAVWVVAHPKKPGEWGAKASAPGLYEVSGSAHWANKADYGVVVHRPDASTTVTEMSVTKVRMGLPGYQRAIRLNWQWSTADYADGGNNE